MTKKELRQFIKNQILEHSGELAAESQKICNNILASKEFAAAKIIFSYMPLPDEVDLLPLADEIFKLGKTLALPKIDMQSQTMQFFLIHNQKEFSEGVKTGSYGILEPDSSLELADPLSYEENALFLVPGRAFTQDGKRLGRGKGYYDKYLDPICKKMNFFFAGVCFSFQFVEELPCDEHDILMQKVFSLQA